MTHLAYLSLYVNDPSAGRQFYGDYLGLPVVKDEEWGSHPGRGDASLFLHPRKTGDVQHVELTFDVEDADTTMAALRERGVRVLDEVADREVGRSGRCRCRPRREHRLSAVAAHRVG